MQKKTPRENIDLSERPLRDFLDAGNGHPTHENLMLLRFYTASADNCRLYSTAAVPSDLGRCRPEADASAPS